MPVEPLEILDQMYGLRTHPFAPEIGPDGQPIDREVLSRTLDPYLNARELSYFFDFYLWHNKDVMADIDSKHGLKQFQRQQGIDPLLIILSGYEKTGRRSLARLVRKQIKDSHKGVAPIVTEADLMGSDINVNARDLSRHFIDSFAERLERSPSPRRKNWRGDFLIAPGLWIVTHLGLGTSRSSSVYRKSCGHPVHRDR